MQRDPLASCTYILKKIFFSSPFNVSDQERIKEASMDDNYDDTYTDPELTCINL